MTPESKQRIIDAWIRCPNGMKSPPATEKQLADFEKKRGFMPLDFRWFLSTCGGGVVGSEWVDGIEELEATHAKFAEESQGEHGWSIRDVFVIGWDGAGNPYGIRVSDGAVVCEDHNFGGVHEMAPSFESFLTAGLD